MGNGILPHFRPVADHAGRFKGDVLDDVDVHSYRLP